MAYPGKLVMTMTKTIVLLLLTIVFLARCTTVTPPTMWDGNLSEVAWYSQNDHVIVHTRMREGYTPTQEEIDSLVSSVAGRVKAIDNHGLYIVIQEGDRCAMVVGMIQGQDTYSIITYEGNLRTYGLPMIWPTHRMEERIIVINYAWLFGMAHYREHTWFPELVAGRPLPLDSAFVYGE